MSKLYERDCRLCGKHFTATDGRVRLCQTPHPFTCENCGEVFYTKNNAFRKTCSKECQMEQTHKPSDKVYERECSGCGAHFTTNNYKLRFCQNPHPYTCENCGDVFHTDGPKRKTCSKECQWEQTNAKMSELRETDEFKEKHRAGLRDPEVQAKRQAAMEKTLEERYGEGVTNPGQLDWVQDKMKETNKKKYGTEYALQSKEVQDKVKATNMERYGVENPGGLKDTYDKIKQTNMERYGVEHSGQLERIRKANSDRLSDPDMQLKMQKAYAEANDLDDFDFHERTNDEDWQNLEAYLANNKGSLSDHSDHFNVSVRAMRRKIIREDLTRYIEGFHDHSGDELVVAEMLKSLGLVKDIDYRANDRKLITPQEIDFMLYKYNVGIEVSPSWYHRIENNYKGYHVNKVNKAEMLGIRLFTKFEWMDANVVLNFILRNSNPEEVGELIEVENTKHCKFSENIITHTYDETLKYTTAIYSNGFITVGFREANGDFEIMSISSDIHAPVSDLLKESLNITEDIKPAYVYTDRSTVSNLDIPSVLTEVETRVQVHLAQDDNLIDYDFDKYDSPTNLHAVEGCGLTKWRVIYDE